MIVTAEKLLTAEEFGEFPDDGRLTELFRGKVIPMNVPYPRHGEICVNAATILNEFVKSRSLGRVIGNDSGVVTERGPDTVRGPDVAYYSYGRVPRGPLPSGYLAVVPELVIEVRSASDRWPPMIAKVAEYLNAGVAVACILDEQTQAAHVYTPDEAVRIVAGDSALTLPEILKDFSVPIARFFE